MQPINTKREHAYTFSNSYTPESPVSHLLNTDILSSYPPYLDNINTQFNFQQQRPDTTSPFSSDGTVNVGNTLMVNTNGGESSDLDIFMMDDLSLDPSSPFDNRNNPPTLNDDSIMMDYGIDPKTINPYMSSQQESFGYQTSYSSSLPPPLLNLSSFQPQQHPLSAYPSSLSRYFNIPPPSFSKRPSFTSTDDLFSDSEDEEGSKPIPIPSQPISFTSTAPQRPSTAPVGKTTAFSPAGTYSCVCGKKFGNITSLRNHAKLHTVRERNFLCVYEGCGKAFLRKQDLKRHETIHLENYHPYSCSNCGTTFTRSDALSRHLKARRCLDKE